MKTKLFVFSQKKKKKTEGKKMNIKRRTERCSLFVCARLQLKDDLKTDVFVAVPLQ